MAHVTLGEAARQTGRSKSQISRAIRAGQLSAERSAETASFRIEQSELQRWLDATNVIRATVLAGVEENPATGAQHAALEAQVERFKEARGPVALATGRRIVRAGRMAGSVQAATGAATAATGRGNPTALVALASVNDAARHCGDSRHCGGDSTGNLVCPGRATSIVWRSSDRHGRPASRTRPHRILRSRRAGPKRAPRAHGRRGGEGNPHGQDIGIIGSSTRGRPRKKAPEDRGLKSCKRT